VLLGCRSCESAIAIVTVLWPRATNLGDVLLGCRSCESAIAIVTVLWPRATNLGDVLGRIQQWSQPPAQPPRVGNVWPFYWLSKRQAKTRRVISQFWDRARLSPGISDIGDSVVAGLSSAPKNLLKVSHSMVSACHGSRILLALDRHVRNHVLAERFGAPPNGPVWTSVPFRCRWSSKTKRSHGPLTRPIR